MSNATFSAQRARERITGGGGGSLSGLEHLLCILFLFKARNDLEHVVNGIVASRIFCCCCVDLLGG